MTFLKITQSYFVKLKSIYQKLSDFIPVTTIQKSKMEIPIIIPPSTVKNMTKLDRDAFTKIVSVPSVILPMDHLQDVVKKNCKKFMLKFKNLNPVMILPNEGDKMRRILLDPSLISSPDDIQTKMGIDLGEINGKFSVTEVTLKYENWKSEQILRAVLPEDSDGSSSFSIIGHILHLNLREHLIPYKTLIAQVYLDKLPNISLVVNKVDIIDNADNTFRTFSLEKLGGVTDTTVTSVKENNCIFTFDFSKVYWNPRLSTEHARIISKLKREDTLFDVMAGVGPFSIPAAKKKCSVFANDLNPFSYDALVENCKRNKVTDQIECFNLDGNEFIRRIFQSKYREIIEDNKVGNVHVTMNLPSIAVQFLPSFFGLYSSDILHIPRDNEISKLPIIHVYLFSFNETKEYAIHTVAAKLGYCKKELVLTESSKSIDTQIIVNNIQSKFWDQVLEVINVRRVAPAKVMFRVSFRLPQEVLTKEIDNNTECHPSKKLKV